MEKSEQEKAFGTMLMEIVASIAVIDTAVAALIAESPDADGILRIAEKQAMTIRQQWFQEGKQQRLRAINDAFAGLRSLVESAQSHRADPDHG